MDVHVHRSSLGGYLRVKIFLRDFFNLLGVVGNLCEANVSNQDPWWTGKNGRRAWVNARLSGPKSLSQCCFQGPLLITSSISCNKKHF